MKRWILLGLLFLVFGAVVNVALAWACAWASAENVAYTASPLHPVDDDDAKWWMDHVGFNTSSAVWRATTSEEIGLEVHYLYAVSGKRTVLGVRAWAGWPAFCLTGGRWKMLGGEGRSAGAGISDGLSLKALLSHVSLREPLWSGFVFNTLFYAIILWLLIPGPFVLRRLIRIKRGRCPKCGYDLRGAPSGGCPECGWNRAARAIR